VERPDLFPEILQKAFQLAESDRPGPVLVSVPMDIFSKKVDTALFERLRHHTLELHRPTIDESVAEDIIRSLAGAKRPLVYAGGGILLANAADELREFVDYLGLPVAHSLMGKGALPDDHPLVLGMSGFWGTKFVNDFCLQSDLVFGAGTRFAEADCSSWDPRFTFSFPPTKLIHIDIDPNEIGRNFPVEIGAVADLKEALTVLNRVAKRVLPSGRKDVQLVERIAQYRTQFAASNAGHIANSAYPMRPERILADVREVLPRDGIVTTDVGWNKNGVGQQFPIYTPGSILTPGGYATMGFGAPAALGAKLACPDRVVVALVGDGGFGQNPSVLATAAEENIPVVWIVMNNGAYGTIAGLEMAHYGTTYGTVFKRNGRNYSPDFAAIARAYGIDGVSIETAEQFKPTFEHAITSGRPFVIDVAMMNEPVPTAGHWNINEIYSPDRAVSHVAVA
jgi:acetolactate synthase-1/2/3 large subunit